MAGFQRILFPVDFSPRAEATVPFVKEMASRGGSSITLLHALPLPVALGAAGPQPKTERLHAGFEHGSLGMHAYAFTAHDTDGDTA